MFCRDRERRRAQRQSVLRQHRRKRNWPPAAARIKVRTGIMRRLSLVIFFFALVVANAAAQSGRRLKNPPPPPPPPPPQESLTSESATAPYGPANTGAPPAGL